MCFQIQLQRHAMYFELLNRSTKAASVQMKRESGCKADVLMFTAYDSIKTDISKCDKLLLKGKL